MAETFEYSKDRHAQNNRKNIAAKIGIATGTAGVAISWCIDMGFIKSDFANSPDLLAAGALAGFLCVGVSIMHLRNW